MPLDCNVKTNGFTLRFGRKFRFMLVVNRCKRHGRRDDGRKSQFVRQCLRFCDIQFTKLIFGNQPAFARQCAVHTRKVGIERTDNLNIEAVA